MDDLLDELNLIGDYCAFLLELADQISLPESISPDPSLVKLINHVLNAFILIDCPICVEQVNIVLLVGRTQL